MARQKRHRVTVVSKLPKNPTKAQVREAERLLDLARSAQTMTPDQLRRRQETSRPAASLRSDGKSRNTRTRKGQERTAIRDSRGE